ncbi:MAG: hypothetical protein U9R50_03505 [Campylobacterota bacterium]|nr:hypothetical protein [Campylobacterota bacterium]
MLYYILTLIITVSLFSGCVNKRGISGRYYNTCHEYYDLQGYYHKECDENIIDFKTKEPESDTEGKKVW